MLLCYLTLWGWCVCRNEGSNVDDAVATLILAPIPVWLDVGTGTPAPTTPTKESLKAFLGIRERSGEEENTFFHGSESKTQISNSRHSERKVEHRAQIIGLWRMSFII